MTQPALYTGPTAADLPCIPDVLKALDQWIIWRLTQESKATGELHLVKTPQHPTNFYTADAHDPSHWLSFEACLKILPKALITWKRLTDAAYRGGGIGLVLTAEDPYALIDLDKSIDVTTGRIAAWASDIVETLQSYTQYSVSRQGLHTLIKGTIPSGGDQYGDVQMWDHRRFCAMTGWHLPETPPTIEARDSQLRMVHAAFILKPKAEDKAAKRQAKSETYAPSIGTPTLTDVAILTKARRADNSSKFNALWDGNIAGYPSHSEADAALCTLLAFWTRNPDQIDSLFRQSGLYREDKWSDRDDYRERTIAGALETQTESYNPEAWLDAQRRAAHPERLDTGKRQGPDMTRPKEAKPTPGVAMTPDATNGEGPSEPEEDMADLVHRLTQAPSGHVLPDHLANHPDPRVRRHWTRVYQRTNAYKRRLQRDPDASLSSRPPEGA